MKTAYRISCFGLVLAILVYPSITLSQNNFICGTGGTQQMTQFHGRYLPEQGLIRALVVYVKFPDDNGTWPPSDYQNVIASTNITNYPAWSLSDYYRKMSNGSQTTGLNLIGDVYPSLIEVPHPISYYTNLNLNYGDVNRDVCSLLVSIPTINFVNYDNWRFDGDYNHTNTPDGKVDMIILMYRSIPLNLKAGNDNFSGIACLGEGQANLNTNNYHLNGQRVYISFASWMDNTSGITISRSWYDMGVVAHEFGHFLFGGGHHDGSGIMGGNFWPAMSAPERVQLGYSTYTTVATPQTDYLLSDYLTSNEVCRYSIGGNEYFIFENHQKNSIYDGVGGKVDSDPRGKGLYVFHQFAGGLGTHVECADGRWNWQLQCQPINPYDPSNTTNVWQSLDPNPNSGLNELERWVVWREDACPTLTLPNDWTGDGNGDNEDAFNMNYSKIFSPWSNSNSNRLNGTSSNLAMELLSMNSGVALIHFYFGNPADAPPSKPQALSASHNLANCSTQINLTWVLNQEPDIINGLGTYKIYRSLDGTNYTQIGAVQHPTSTFQDDISSLNIGVSTIYYKVSAVDNTLKESVLSDPTTPFYIGNGIIISNVTTQDQTVYVLGDVTVAAGATWEIRGNSNLEFCPGADIYVNGTLILQKVLLSENNNFVCRNGGRIIFPDEAIVENLNTMTIEDGGTLETRNGCDIKMKTNGEILIYGAMITAQGVNSIFESYVLYSLWQGITFDHTNQLVSPSSISNLTIKNAINGITTNYSQPEISSCFFFNNSTAGMNIIGDSPILIDNKFENNFHGLIGYQMNTDIFSNRFGYNLYGAQLLNCGNVWYDNKADHNYIGVLEDQGSSVDFNRNGNQDLGNGMRYNTEYGIEARDNSDPELTGWNSVYNNGVCDLVADGNSFITGNNNAMPTSCTQGKVYWWNPTSIDWVETYLTGGSQINFTNWSDQQLFDYAHSKKYSGEYSTAVDALKELHGRGIQGAYALQGAKLWYKILLDAWFNAPNNDPISQNIESSKNDFHQRITNNLPLNSVPGRKLFHLSSQLKSYSKQFDSSIAMLDQLISNTPTISEKQFYMLDKLLAELYGKGSKNNATAVYQQMSNLDASSKYVVEAKMLLGIPFTIVEWKTAFGYPNITPSPLISVVEESKPMIESFVLYQNHPNPFNSTTVISYELRYPNYVNLSVIDLFGREVAVLVNENQNNGNYSSTLHGVGLKNGLYYYKLQVGDKIKIRKMCLLR